MTKPSLATVLHHLRRAAETTRDARLSDRQLLENYLSHRDEAAFAVLVRRHGPLVLSACRRVLTEEADVEDAFQATFLVLLRKASSICWQKSIGNWLFAVAHRIAVEARGNVLRRRRRESQASRERQRPEEASSELTWREAIGLLHEELNRLPDKYRLPLMLCYLDGKTREEAAQMLDCSAGAIKGRLERGRMMLRNCLIRRGVTLSGALLAAAVDAPIARSVAPDLVQATLNAAKTGVYRVSVSALIKAAAPALWTSKVRLVIGMLLAVSLFALGGRSTVVSSSAAPEPPVARQAERRELPHPSAQEKPAQAMVVRGRVFAPDGKPVAGARLYWPRVRKEWNPIEKDIAMAQRGVTDSQGRFKLELSRDDVRAGRDLPLLAIADGYGVTGAELPRGKSSVELTLKLVEDQPIRGRIVNTEGKPLAGIRVSVVEVDATAEERLDSFLTARKHGWNLLLAPFIAKKLYLPTEKSLLSVTTDKEGRFCIRGAGKERVVVLRVHGAGIAQGLLHVINRAGFDPEPFRRALRENSSSEFYSRGWPPLLCGPTIDYVADPVRFIEGIIREVGSGKPVAGATVSCEVGAFDSVHAMSDAQGRYRLEGVAKVKKYWLRVKPNEKDPLLPAVAEVTGTAGWQSLHADFKLARGVVVSGQVIDRATGQGVPGGVRYVPLLGNNYCGKKPGYDLYRYQWEQMPIPTDAEGRFRLVVIPSLSVLAASTNHADRKIGGQPVSPYKAAEFEPDDLKHVSLRRHEQGYRFFLTAGQTPDTAREWLDNLNAVKVLDLADDSAPVACNLFVDRGKTLTIHIQDRNGKPLPGTVAAGLTESGTYTLREATCTVYALDAKKPRQSDWVKGLQILGVPNVFAKDAKSPRQLAFIHRGRQLAATQTVHGDEKEPLVVRLVPAGVVTGRVLDGEGQPIAGASISLFFLNPRVGQASRHLELLGDPIRTGKDGRFRWECVIPQQKFYLLLKHGHAPLDNKFRTHFTQVKSGETLDLGDVRTTPLGTK